MSRPAASPVELSQCCDAPVRLDSGRGLTRFYVCTLCGKPCDVKQERVTEAERP